MGGDERVGGVDCRISRAPPLRSLSSARGFGSSVTDGFAAASAAISAGSLAVWSSFPPLLPSLWISAVVGLPAASFPMLASFRRVFLRSCHERVKGTKRVQGLSLGSEAMGDGRARNKGGGIRA